MGRILLREAAFADGRSDRPEIGISALIDGGRLSWIRPTGDEGDLGPKADLEIIDASGGTIVPGLVDGHSHITLPGGAHYLDRIDDGPEALLRAADRNGRLLTRAGVRWARDVGSPRYPDPEDGGRTRALALGVRDRWRSHSDRPYLVAAGTWLERTGTLPAAVHAVSASNADELYTNAVGQLDEGADLLKLYLDGPDPATSPWSPDEVQTVTTMAHARGAKVTAHASRLSGAAAGVLGGVDSIEHGEELDADVCAEMVRRGTFLVSTLSVYASWAAFASTTAVPRYTTEPFAERVGERQERARASVSLAHRVGVKIVAGTDFGGGSMRAGHLAGEVELLVQAGLEPWEALAAATWRGGELMGNDAGVLREGGPADFLIVHGNPLESASALWRLWWVGWQSDVGFGSRGSLPTRPRT